MVVRRIEVPAAALAEVSAEDSHAAPDYDCAFELTSATTGSAEQWARATFEGAGPLSGLLYLAWRYGLGFRLGPRSAPDHVLGCRVVRTEAGLVVLEQRSRLMTAHNVVISRESGVLWVTFVKYQRPVGRPLWSVAAVVHRRVLPYLLNRAAG